MTVRTIKLAGPLQVAALEASVSTGIGGAEKAELGVLYLAERVETDRITRQMTKTKPGWFVVSFRHYSLVSRVLRSAYEAHSLAAWLSRDVDWTTTDLPALQEQVRRVTSLWREFLPENHGESLGVKRALVDG